MQKELEKQIDEIKFERFSLERMFESQKKEADKSLTSTREGATKQHYNHDCSRAEKNLRLLSGLLDDLEGVLPEKDLLLMDEIRALVEDLEQSRFGTCCGKNVFSWISGTFFFTEDRCVSRQSPELTSLENLESFVISNALGAFITPQSAEGPVDLTSKDEEALSQQSSVARKNEDASLQRNDSTLKDDDIQEVTPNFGNHEGPVDLSFKDAGARPKQSSTATRDEDESSVRKDNTVTKEDIREVRTNRDSMSRSTVHCGSHRLF